MPRSDRPGRIVGLIVFLIGIGVLVFAAVLTYHYFIASLAQPAFSPTKGSTTPATVRLGQQAIVLLVQVLLLIVLAFVGSLIAGRGIHMYYASGGSREDRSREATE